MRFPLLSLLALVGCASQGSLAIQYNQLTEDLTAAHAATNCSPRDLAMADAHYDFVRLEFQQGDTRRAQEHLLIAQEHVNVAKACAGRELTTAEPLREPTPTDRDGDGVLDTDDTCPDDREDLDGFRDVDGCPEFDNDGDGVADGVDTCPDQPEDRDGNLDADGCPDPDDDGDGVPDVDDACRTEKGALADKGCPVQDRDGDGVGDRFDACPDQPETVNGYSDEDGCPDTKPSRIEITESQIVIKQRVNFTTGKAVIMADSFPVLDDVVQVMRDYPKIRIEIGGHTDSVGDDTANQRLAKARADAVFEYLLTKGIPGNRMSTVGYGEMAPIDTNNTEAGRLANRRVEFKITAQ